MREVVDFVQGLGADVAVIEDGDCTGWDNAKWIKKLTGGCFPRAITRSNRFSRSVFRDDRHCGPVKSDLFLLNTPHGRRNNAHTIVFATGKQVLRLA